VCLHDYWWRVISNNSDFASNNNWIGICHPPSYQFDSLFSKPGFGRGLCASWGDGTNSGPKMCILRLSDAGEPGANLGESRAPGWQQQGPRLHWWNWDTSHSYQHIATMTGARIHLWVVWYSMFGCRDPREPLQHRWGGAKSACAKDQSDTGPVPQKDRMLQHS